MASSTEEHKEADVESKRRERLERAVGGMVESGGVVGTDVWVIAPKRLSASDRREVGSGERGSSHTAREARAELIDELASKGLLRAAVSYGLISSEIVRPSDWQRDEASRHANEAETSVEVSDPLAEILNL